MFNLRIPLFGEEVPSQLLLITFSKHTWSMIGENRQLGTDEPVEFEKEPVEVQDCRRITDRFRGIYGIYLKSIQRNRRMSACNRLDLQTLGSQPISMPKNLPDHCTRLHCNSYELLLNGQQNEGAWRRFCSRLRCNVQEFSFWAWLFKILVFLCPIGDRPSTAMVVRVKAAENMPFTKTQPIWWLACCRFSASELSAHA